MRYLDTINNTNIAIKEYQGQRVVTFKDVDTVHGRPDGTARKRFSDNREHFIEGEDFFKVKCSEVRPFFGQTPPNGFNPDADIVLVTESGYLMLAKSFTDDKAWQVQRQLVKGYFRAKESVKLSPAEQLLAQAHLMVEQERRIKALEVSNAENVKTMETVKDAIDIMVAPPVTAGNWQSQMNRNVRAFCMQTGLDFHKTFQELYTELEVSAGVKLGVRVKFARQRLQVNGATQTEIAAVSKLSIVAQDKKLREIFNSLYNRMVARRTISKTSTQKR